MGDARFQNKFLILRKGMLHLPVFLVSLVPENISFL